MSEITVAELQPGDVVSLGSESACFVAQTGHPVWPRLRLVVWRLRDGSWSHDALDARQVVGHLSHRGGPSLARAALVGAGRWWKAVPS